MAEREQGVLREAFFSGFADGMDADDRGFELQAAEAFEAWWQSRSERIEGQCAECGHVWVICYLPMALEDVARLMKRAACPACAETRVHVAGPGALSSG